MSLQWRLLLLLGGSFVLLWLSAAGWLYIDLHRQVSATLDHRLASSATMVAGLIARQPELLTAPADNPLLVEPESEDVACQIRSAGGQVLLQTSGANDLLMEKPSTGFSTRTMRESQWRLFTLEHNGLFITTADRMTERTALQNGIIVVMVVPFALALAGSLAALWLGVKQGLSPLKRLSQALSGRAPDNLEPVDIGETPAELRPVLGTLNNLFVRIDRTVRREQRFASNAAHEFRTPLTAIKTHLQVAQKVAGERQQQALTSAECGVGRLQRVTEQLLMLARLEQGSEWPGATESRVDQVIAEATADLPQANRLKVELNGENPILAVPQVLAGVAVRNLIENALKYSAGDHPVELHTYSIPEKFIFMVRDYGHGNDTSAPVSGRGIAESDEIRSHGLGLTIVETIVSRFLGNLHYKPNIAGGQDWVLEFPVDD